MSVDYTAMNPALLSPAQLVTRRMQLRAKEQAPPSSPTQRSNSNINELPAHSPITPLTISTNQIGQRPLPEIADSLKQKFDLQPQDCTELDEFITATLDERLLFQTAILLDMRREQKKVATSSGASISPNLKATARHYSIAVLLSPHISSYAGKSFADIVVKCMRSAGVEGVPSDHQVTNLKALKTTIGDYATQDRFSLKNKVMNSLSEGSPHENIALLAQAIIGTHGFQITVDFLGRLAVLCWAVEEYKEQSTRTFWSLLDAAIDTWCGDGGYKAWGNSVAITVRYMYDEDVKAHGNPADTEIVITDIRNISNAQKSIDDWAKKIVPLPSNDQNKPSEGGHNKQARVDEPQGPEEDNEDEGSDENNSV
ncbi:hypothetical protein C8R41DRAFT_918450 [Lentinula lateritia]|uniref:Uncharacterized protein n=1 Tax=Lentinula lateritia TaxID=40482 RepID=A0ABQ8VJN6_9AGAR|nr:hypothetical protein C8R41DRAFT_918450 [Lentinula lateritia]